MGELQRVPVGFLDVDADDDGAAALTESPPVLRHDDNMALGAAGHRDGGGADQEAGEDEVLAVVVASEAVDPAEILAWCEGRIPAFAIPRYVRVVDSLPKTPSEKVRKAALREDGVTADTYDSTTGKTGEAR